ncbi:MAG: tetratricopeptide repeat protein [Acidobacteria bacterium]|nr:tetratricopeptide repeat protein [Acidobacteriota bacterium]
MQRRNFFLRTKLLVPRAVSDQLPRPRLVERLEANLNSPITIVAADAGCGKTTLVADFIGRQQRSSVWYQLDHTDADPFTFLGYLSEGISQFVPEFGEAVRPYLAEAGGDLLRFPERAADLFINEMLESVEQPFIVVLDDYHHLGTDTPVHQFVDRLIQYSSDILHLIITTRDLPPLAIARRKTQSSALVVTRNDLLFTDEEVRELFRQTLHVELQDDELAVYRDRTHGWITALQLVRQLAEQEMLGASSAPAPDLRAILQRSERDIFDYFAEEVFVREPDATQQLMLRLSVLESMPLEDCSGLFPEMRCSAVLPKLAAKNVFLTVGGENGASEVYRFHPLFRDFLLRRLRSEIGHGKVAAERERVAEYFLSQRRWETAISYLIDAQIFDRAAEIIAVNGNEWLMGGAITSLALSADRIPDDFLEKYPRSLQYRAEVARLQGDGDRAAALLHKAIKLLHKAKDNTGEAEALHSLASVSRRRGQSKEALELLDKAERLVSKDSETFLKCTNTRGLCLVGTGNWAEAERQFRLALELAEKLSNEHYIRLVTHNLALAPGFRGDFGEALRWFKRIFRDAQRGNELPQEAIGHLNVARLHQYRGEFDEVERHLERALELSQLYNLKVHLGEIFEAYGNLYREKADFGHAAEYYERARKAYDDAEVEIASRELDEELARFSLLTGDAVTARALLENLIESRTAAKNEAGVFTARSLLTRVRLSEGSLDGLVTEIRSVLEFFKANNHYYDEALASLNLAETYFLLGDAAKSLEPLQRVIDLSARFDYDHWLRGEMRRNKQLFAQEEIAGRLPVDLRNVLDEKPKPASADRAAAAEIALVPVTDLTVNVLGPVDIYRDPSKSFAPDAWTTRRARDIFCFVATSKHRRIAKDVLIESFWPDEDPATVEKNFHPTISHIRKALNSRQAFKQNFLIFRDGAYLLNPEMSYSIDSEDFERYIVDAENAKRDKDNDKLRESLEAAIRLYRGEFMPGIYDAWAEERRTYYSEQFLRVVGAMAKLSFSEKKWNNVIRYAGDLLREDPYREDMHRLLMKVHAVQGKPAAVKEQFDALRTLLKNELGIEPSAETRRIYQELLKTA